MATDTGSSTTMNSRDGLKFTGHSRPPDTFLHVVRCLMPGVRILAANASPDASHALVMLCAHVLECLLKAYLSRDGPDNKVTGPTIRHNLCKLWECAYVEGLPVQKTPPAWVDRLSHLHDNPFILRYRGGDCGGIYLPTTEPITTELEGLIEIVQQAMRKPSPEPEDKGCSQPPLLP